MKKIFLLNLTVICVGLVINSCQKEQDKLATKDEIQISMSAKPGNAAGETTTGLPDLTIDAGRLQTSIIFRNKVFKTSDCAVSELCVNGTGKRKLLRFDVAISNIGFADLILGDPSNNDLFELSPCHGHYHFSGFANYELLNTSGTTTVLTGHKQAFCLLDYSRVDPAAGPAKYTCSNQGISVGWQDVYGSYLDCQWLDITGIPAGDYLLRVSINPGRRIIESNHDNNIASVLVKISK